VAYETVVRNPFVTQIAEFVRRTGDEKGKYALAMLLPSEAGVTDKWNLVLSAPWIDNAGLKAAIPTITSLLQRHLSKVNLSKIERISVLPTTSPFVTELFFLDISPGAAKQVQAPALARRGIEDAIVLAAQQPGPAGYHQKQSAHSRA